MCFFLCVCVCVCKCINMLEERESACVWEAVCMYKDLLEAGDI